MKATQVGDMRTVACLDSDFIFVSDSQDTAAVKEHIGESASEYDSFFVRIKDGDYTEVWAMCGILPRLDKLISRLVLVSSVRRVLRSVSGEVNLKGRCIKHGNQNTFRSDSLQQSSAENLRQCSPIGTGAVRTG